MWADVLNKPKQGNIFREFRGEPINIELEYDEEVERENTSDKIAGGISEGANELNTVNKISYSEELQT